jgi:hypothetical protein
MGLVLLDITFRVEKAFNIQIPDGWHAQLGLDWKTNNDATVGQYHEFLLRLCDEQHVLPPPDSWKILIGVIQDASGLRRDKITAETRLIADIAPSGLPNVQFNGKSARKIAGHGSPAKSLRRRTPRRVRYPGMLGRAKGPRCAERRGIRLPLLQ